MKKLIVALCLFCIAFTAFAAQNPIQEVKSRGHEGRMNAGIALGYPSGLIFGYRLYEKMEFNVIAGTHYNDLLIGGNFLFTLVDIKINNLSFPLSLGPTLHFEFIKPFDIALLAVVRWEHTLKNAPFNFYIEAGPGMAFIQGISFRWTAALGARYLF